ncbi:MAG: helicase-related protein [Caldilinea sp.]
MKGIGMLGVGRGTHVDPIRAHHGSMSKETRLALEQALKAGTLPALVGTSSLELGIDIGSVDLVVQLQSPKSVAQGLQRVGCAGHVVGQTNCGRIFPTHREDIMEAAAVAGGMLRSEVEPIHTPRNSLDILGSRSWRATNPGVGMERCAGVAQPWSGDPGSNRLSARVSRDAVGRLRD